MIAFSLWHPVVESGAVIPGRPGAVVSHFLLQKPGEAEDARNYLSDGWKSHPVGIRPWPGGRVICRAVLIPVVPPKGCMGGRGDHGDHRHRGSLLLLFLTRTFFCSPWRTIFHNLLALAFGFAQRLLKFKFTD
jgi:hypothetical protein